MTEKPKGQLVCVGPGMILGAHITERCRNYIQRADVVYVSCHHAVEEWLATLNPDTISLQNLYAEGKHRRETYNQMHQTIMQSVREGKKVVGCFYGHPGVFAQVPHWVINTAREEGYKAHMEPGISAEDCLYADMGIDPGRFGCQHFEASQLLFYRRTLDPSAYLILWQIALAGDRSIAKRVSSVEERQQLVDILLNDYPADHKVAVYECPFIMVEKPRIEWFPLSELSTYELNPVSTLVIPPATKMQPR
ncbi:hypothetical protein DRW07_05100 [Alteromonas sediminis]|uniref:Tetrapyrrole methylase domain-containing protein n=1 Tax=Alteromonas sediminis TaxID=2259342 RepID=A0A3N5Y641_9ALTE|nr:SAM-dependent methyltransferase [Alteromonas sediminis]RPJ68773.1 hypothetical protein DRW07_05100 [Alteromonas sediminis]